MGRTATTAKPGNMLALKHGGYRSPETLAPRTAEILAELEEFAPLQQPIDRFALRMTATAFARFEEVSSYFEQLDGKGKKRGALDSRGRPRAALKLYIALFREVHRGLAAHGGTAMARALMGPGLAALQRDRAAEQARERIRAKQRMGESR